MLLVEMLMLTVACPRLWETRLEEREASMDPDFWFTITLKLEPDTGNSARRIRPVRLRVVVKVTVLPDWFMVIQSVLMADTLPSTVIVKVEGL